MGAEQIIAIGFVAILAIGVAVAAIFNRDHGRDDQKLKEAVKDAKDLRTQVERRSEPVAPDSDYLERLRRAQKRLARLRNRKTKY